MNELFQAWIQHDPLVLARALGYVGVASLVFAESGILLGMFLPGDSLLFAAGLLAGGGLFNIYALVALVVAAAIAGDSVGYWFGQRAGARLFARPDSIIFKQEYLARTEAFYARHGARAVIFARFVPVVRTLAPMLAGVGSMSYRTFVTYNIVGGVAWGAGITILGYLLGATVPAAETYVLPISLAIIGVSLLPVVIAALRARH